MIHSVDRNKCCGCGACSNACPARCIAMREDAEGFLSPFVDSKKCIRCGKCLTVCPIAVETRPTWPTVCYAYRAKDVELLSRTSSGGFFTAVASKILEGSGVVFGASINESNEVAHRFVEKTVELDALRRSKYVQSNIGDSFSECRRFIEEGRTVLFCGTPCQVKALHLFLGSGYKNLITMDFVCHGVPSPGVFKKYLSELAHKKSEKISDLCNINFRNKEIGFAYSFSCEGLFGKYVENPQENKFLKGFLADIYLRQSCYNCSAKRFTSGADYTMCDFWEVNRFLPKFGEGAVPGVSLVFTREDPLGMFDHYENNANALVERLDGRVSKYMPIWALKSVPYTRRRARFFSAISNSVSIYDAVSQYSELTFCEIIRRMPTRFINAMLKRAGLK